MSKKTTDHTLNKCDELIERLTELKKALDQVNVQSTRKPVNSLPAGWSSDAGGALHHSSYGVISPGKQSDGTFIPRHSGGGGHPGGPLKTPTNPKGVYHSIQDAGRAMGAHARMLHGTETGVNNRQSPAVPTTPKMGTGNSWAKKSEDEDLDKSGGFKFKGGNTYDTAANVKRKANNTGSVAGEGKNVNVKAFSTKPGQLSAKQQADKTPYKGAAGPVKQYTPEQIAAINEARKLKKNSEELPWITHAGVPNADREIEHVQKTNPAVKAENLMSNQLANMMQGRSMLGTPPPRQPTDEEMFGRFVPSEEEIQKAESQWNNRMNWLEEAMKPIASRFNSPEEEEQYWNSIKVTDRDDGKPGY